MVSLSKRLKLTAEAVTNSTVKKNIDTFKYLTIKKIFLLSLDEEDTTRNTVKK